MISDINNIFKKLKDHKLCLEILLMKKETARLIVKSFKELDQLKNEGNINFATGEVGYYRGVLLYIWDGFILENNNFLCIATPHNVGLDCPQINLENLSLYVNNFLCGNNIYKKEENPESYYILEYDIKREDFNSILCYNKG